MNGGRLNRAKNKWNSIFKSKQMSVVFILLSHFHDPDDFLSPLTKCMNRNAYAVWFVLSFCCVRMIRRHSFWKLLLDLQLLEDKLKRGLISTGQYGGDDDSGRETDDNADTKANEKSIGIADENVLDLSLKVTHNVERRDTFSFIQKKNVQSNSVLYSWTSFRFQLQFWPIGPHVHSRRWLIQIEPRQCTKENDRLHIPRATRVCWQEGQPEYRFPYRQGKIFSQVKAAGLNSRK